MSSTSFNQRTLREPIACEGVGLHSGSKVSLRLIPAPADHGIVFVRTDLSPQVAIPARAEHVVDTSLATTLGITAVDPEGGAGGARRTVRIGTVEHLLAALSGMGVDNVRVEVDGPEVPIMDGSAAPFAYLIKSAGIRVQSEPKSFIVIKKPVRVVEGDKEACFSPSDRLRISCRVDFRHPLISDQSYELEFSDRAFSKEIARARTFGFLKDVERLKAAGLARGGSLENAIVVDEFSILNPDGLRFPDEFVRHKILDALGDVSLFGRPVIGHLRAVKTGHALNQRLVQAVLADPSAYEVVRAKRREAERTDGIFEPLVA